MRDLTEYWLDEIDKDFPDYFEDKCSRCPLGYHLDEYWHVTFNPETFETTLDAECGDPDTYRSPEFVEKARLIAQEFYKKHYSQMLEQVGDMLKEADKRNVTPERIILPHWITCDLKSRMKTLYGVRVYSDSGNKIRIEAPDDCFMVEKEYEE